MIIKIEYCYNIKTAKVFNMVIYIYKLYSDLILQV